MQTGLQWAVCLRAVPEPMGIPWGRKEGWEACDPRREGSTALQAKGWQVEAGVPSPGRAWEKEGGCLSQLETESISPLKFHFLNLGKNITPTAEPIQSVYTLPRQREHP